MTLVRLVKPLALALPVLVIAWFTSCTQNQKGCRTVPDASPLKTPVSIKRLDLSFWNGDTTLAGAQNWLKNNPGFTSRYQKGMPGLDETTFATYMNGMRKDFYLDTMRRETAQLLGDLKDVDQELTQGFTLLKHYYPQAVIPEIHGFVTGFTFDVSIADSSLIIIGLESFLAGKGHYTPPMMPRYILRRMKRSAIAPLTFMAVSNRYNKRDVLDATLLADMVNWGKTYYFVEQVLPCAPDSNIIGFNPDEMEFASKKEKEIYGYLTQKQLFYITNHLEKRRFVEERPKVPEINERCPGRIARYIGWQIVRAYAKNTGKTLPEIMAEQNAQQILNKSGYKP